MVQIFIYPPDGRTDADETWDFRPGDVIQAAEDGETPMRGSLSDPEDWTSEPKTWHEVNPTRWPTGHSHADAKSVFILDVRTAGGGTVTKQDIRDRVTEVTSARRALRADRDGEGNAIQKLHAVARRNRKLDPQRLPAQAKATLQATGRLRVTPAQMLEILVAR